MSDERITIKRGAAVWRRLQEETVILDLEQDAYLALNPSASALWSALADGASRQDLIQLLVDRYAVEPETATADVDTFLEQCQRRGLVERRS